MNRDIFSLVVIPVYEDYRVLMYFFVKEWFLLPYKYENYFISFYLIENSLWEKEKQIIEGVFVNKKKSSILTIIDE